MVQKPTNLRAKECDKTPLGNVNQKTSHFSSYLCLFWSLACSFAFQYGLIVSRDLKLQPKAY